MGRVRAALVTRAPKLPPATRDWLVEDDGSIAGNGVEAP
jgi:hypothetical protein